MGAPPISHPVPQAERRIVRLADWYSSTIPLRPFDIVNSLYRFCSQYDAGGLELASVALKSSTSTTYRKLAMKLNRLPSRSALFVTLAMTALAGLFTPQVQAAEGNFSITVYHGINGRSLGLSKALPVAATVESDGVVVGVLELEFGDKVEASLTPGTYLITVESVEAGPLPSMTVGPVEIPAGVNVALHAKLSGNKTPVIKAQIK